MAGQEVTLDVRANLQELIRQLASVNTLAEDISRNMSDSGKNVSDGLRTKTKEVEGFLTKTSGFARKLANGIKQDFSAMFSLQGLAAGMKLSDQFKNTLKESISLNDAVRRLGATFNLTGDQQTKFISKMARGLGELGVSADVGGRILEGLADTTVRGEDSLLGYAKAAAMLASIGGAKGQEGAIAGSLARVLTAKGANAEDPKERQALVEATLRAMTVTGKKPAEILNNMESIFGGMADDFRKLLTAKGVAQLGVLSQVGGPGSTEFFKQLLGSDEAQRSVFEARGFGGVMGKEGFDMNKFAKAARSALAVAGGDRTLAARTMGLEGEAAQGFIRLVDNLDLIEKKFAELDSTTGDLEKRYRGSLGLLDAFRANLSRVGSSLSEFTSPIIQKMTDFFTDTAKSNTGSALVAGGAGLLATVLAGGGLRGIGKALGGGGGLVGGLAKGAALSQVGVQPVYVVNAKEIGGAGLPGAGLAGAGGALGMAGKALGMAGVAYAGFEAGQMLSEPIHNAIEGTKAGELIGRFEQSIANLILKLSGPTLVEARPSKVIVETAPNLRTTKQPTRGGSH